MKPPVSSPPGSADQKGRRGLPAEAPRAFLFRVELPLPPKILSPNVRAHWAVKSSATKRERAAAAWVFKFRKPKGWTPVPIEIDVEYRCPKDAGGYIAQDEQNAKAALKATIDGMVDAGIIPTDSHKWLSWGAFSLVTTKRDPAFKARGEGVTITVRSR